ncbi:MAG TPA: penicillin acylase family protein [Thermoleophilaceae bacterium]|nr:penicillin acylase family protein [Thermoleophilaceae bacterium]
MRGGTYAAVAVASALLALPTAGGAQETAVEPFDFGGFRNVLPGGQGETVNATEFAAFQTGGDPPATFVNQLPLYNGLIGAAPTLTNADLDQYFKPAAFGVDGAMLESEPRDGVAIYRDEWSVPKVFGATRSDSMFGAGYVSAQDRLFLMDVLRHTARARLSELAGPANLEMDAAQLLVADYDEDELQQMLDRTTAAAGAEGAQMKQDLIDFVDGVNAYIAEARTDPSKMPVEYPALGKTIADWKVTDTVAIASLIGGIFGKGGGEEARVSLAYQALRERFGRRKGHRAYHDFRDYDDPEAPVTTHREFPYRDAGAPDRKAYAMIDQGSFEAVDPIVSGEAPAGAADAAAPFLQPREASNVLLVGRRESKSGGPIAVMGPQVGYYSPQILMEMEIHGPDGLHARGATFPGISLYVLLGRGQDFAWSATTANTDIVDQFVEKLCEPDGSEPTTGSDHYVYKGECVPFKVSERQFQTSKALTDLIPPPDLSPPQDVHLRVHRSVHGPIQARATVDGEPVAIAEARSTYFHELESSLAFKRLNFNEVTSARGFQRTMRDINFAFNWFYADDRDIAYQTSGWYPRRAQGTHPDFPAWGTGRWDWRGFDAADYSSKRVGVKRLPRALNPKQGYLVNWNNKQAPGWRAADDYWNYGSIQRVTRLEDRMRRGIRRKRKLDLAGLTRAMELGATTDLRGWELYPWLRRVTGRGNTPETRAAIALLDAWVRAGSHRRDLDGDNVVEHGAAIAVMDEWWPLIARGIFRPVLGETAFEAIRDVHGFGGAPTADGSAFGSGWWSEVHTDLRSLVGARVGDPLSRPYCGRGKRKRCRAILLGALAEATGAAKERYGVEALADIEMQATCDDGDLCDEISFTTGGAVGLDDIHWQDRPTFQQIVEVEGHRPR